MKKIITVVILLICFHIVIKAQSSGWFFINPLPTNATLNSIKVFNQNNAIIIGYSGTVMRTSDGGLNWSNPLSTTSKIYKTTNMGATWTFVSQFNSIARVMYFINQNTGWVGNTTLILKTTNGGSSWQNLPTSFPSEISSILFQNDQTGFAAVYRKIFKTSDGGLNWNVVDSSGVSYSNLFFINLQTGFACGSLLPRGSLIKKTTNSGETWTTKLSNTTTDILSSVYFTDASTGFSVGSGYLVQPGSIYRSTDAGETWNLTLAATNYHLNSIGFSGNLGLIVGYGGKVLRSTDQGLNWSVSPAFHQAGLGFYSLSFIDANTGWTAIGGYTGSSPIYMSTNGGLNWVNISMVTPGPDWMQFLNANTGFYRLGNTLYKSTNSGYNWAQLPLIGILVNSMNFVDVNTGWACGYTNSPLKPRVIKTINGGNTWDTIPVPLDYSIVYSFSFINNNTGWISKTFSTYPMGYYSKIFGTTNGGQSWADLRTDTNVIYSKISFLNNLTGWTSGTNKFIKTTNGGNSWINMQTNIATPMFQFIDVNTGWAAGSGLIYKTTNGGLNWYSQVDIGLANIQCMQFINSQTGWMVGGDGLIIKTTNGGEPLGIYSISKDNNLPKNYSLFQNYPNPFNPTTKIQFALPKTSFAKLIIYDILGREIAMLVNEKLSPGTYAVEWDGRKYSSGVYFYKITAGDFSETKKLVLIK
jgi:photosystem II stability/assembly factor-like uncharacterized protein